MFKLTDILKEVKSDLPIKIDNVNGLGAVPSNQNIDYEGFTLEMTPLEFLRLVPSRNYPSTADEMFEKMKKQGIGSPFLSAAYIPVPYDPNMKYSADSKGIWKVIGHEGRGRMMIILEHYGNDDKYPVQIFPYRLKNKHLTDEMKNVSPRDIYSETDNLLDNDGNRIDVYEVAGEFASVIKSSFYNRK